MTWAAFLRPLATLMFVTGVVILGVKSYQLLRVESLPSSSTNVISTHIDWAGATPKDVQETIVKPFEEAVSRLAGAIVIQTQAGTGRGFVIATFADGVDLNNAAVELDRRISEKRAQITP